MCFCTKFSPSAFIFDLCCFNDLGCQVRNIERVIQLFPEISVSAIVYHLGIEIFSEITPVISIYGN